MTMEKKAGAEKKKGRNFPYIFHLYITIQNTIALLIYIEYYI